MVAPATFQPRTPGVTRLPSVPNVHIAIGNLKSWLIGTHKGVWARPLKAHLDEFVFRYNRRHNLGLAFRTLLGLGASRAPTPYRIIRGAQDMPQIIYIPSRQNTRRRKQSHGSGSIRNR